MIIMAHYGLRHLQHLLKQRLLLLVSATGVDNDDFKVVRSELLHPLLRYHHRIHFCVAGRARGTGQEERKGKERRNEERREGGKERLILGKGGKKSKRNE